MTVLFLVSLTAAKDSLNLMRSLLPASIAVLLEKVRHEEFIDISKEETLNDYGLVEDYEWRRFYLRYSAYTIDPPLITRSGRGQI